MSAALHHVSIEEANGQFSLNVLRRSTARPTEISCMSLEEATLALFAACNSARILAYLPQIHKAAIDTTGASAISSTTWLLFLVAHLSTIAHALINLKDLWLAACFAGNAVCCIAILSISWWKRRQFLARVRGSDKQSNVIPLT